MRQRGWQSWTWENGRWMSSQWKKSEWECDRRHVHTRDYRCDQSRVHAAAKANDQATQWENRCWDRGWQSEEAQHFDESMSRTGKHLSVHWDRSPVQIFEIPNDQKAAVAEVTPLPIAVPTHSSETAVAGVAVAGGTSLLPVQAAGDRETAVAGVAVAAEEALPVQAAGDQETVVAGVAVAADEVVERAAKPHPHVPKYPPREILFDWSFDEQMQKCTRGVV